MSNTQSIKIIIFDCDGVMFDSREANIHFYNHLLARFDQPPMDQDEIHFVHMATGRDAVKHIFRKTPYFEKADAYRLKMDYTPFINDMIMAEGLKELLLKLQSRFLLAVATNRSNTIGTVMEQFGLTGLFDMVVSSLDVKKPKPDPESLFKILDFFELAPDEAVYVGDSQVDLEAAEASAIRFIAYGNGAPGLGIKVSSMRELEEVLNPLAPGHGYLR